MAGRARGKGYLLLQWGEGMFSAGLREWQVFSKLHIKLVESPAEAVLAIEDEFNIYRKTLIAP